MIRINSFLHASPNDQIGFFSCIMRFYHLRPLTEIPY